MLSFLYIPSIIITALIFFLKVYASVVKFIRKRNDKSVCVAFFHPYCNAGGGGERVLWQAIRAIQEKYKATYCCVYSGDGASPIEILKNVEQRFNIKLLRDINIIHIKSRFLVEAKYYPFFTLLMQNLMSIILGFEAFFKHVPDIYIDTMGYSYTLWIFKLFGSCKVGAYVHYPTISTDMLNIVKAREISVNNKQFISNSNILSTLKVVYYNLFAFVYRIAGSFADVIMVNSSWTKNHILNLWKKPQKTSTVYPPCDVTEFNKIPLDAHSSKVRILSIAQFRPEKNHKLQIHAFQSFLKSTRDFSAVLVLIGSCRDQEDYKRVEELKKLCGELNLEQNVLIKVNLTFKDLIDEMTSASIALHTMKDEHFGIGIVECMSAGLIMIAHNSGGPKLDIVVDHNGQKTGFLAFTAEEFANAVEKVYRMSPKELLKLRTTARKSVERFSVEKFNEAFIFAIRSLFS